MELASDLSLQVIQQSLDVFAQQSLLQNIDNALLDVCPLSLCGGIELSGANDIDPSGHTGISLSAQSVTGGGSGQEVLLGGDAQELLDALQAEIAG